MEHTAEKHYEPVIRLYHLTLHKTLWQQSRLKPFPWVVKSSRQGIVQCQIPLQLKNLALGCVLFIVSRLRDDWIFFWVTDVEKVAGGGPSSSNWLNNSAKRLKMLASSNLPLRGNCLSGNSKLKACQSNQNQKTGNRTNDAQADMN